DTEQPLPLRSRRGSVEVGHLMQRVHTGVGAPGAVDVHRLTGYLADCSGKHAFHAAASLLDLPADEVGAVVLETQCDSWHTRRSEACNPAPQTQRRHAAVVHREGKTAQAVSTSIRLCASRRWFGSPSSRTSSRILRAPSGSPMS